MVPFASSTTTASTVWVLTAAMAFPAADPQRRQVGEVILVQVADEDLVKLVVGDLQSAQVGDLFRADVEDEFIAIAQLNQHRS